MSTKGKRDFRPKYHYSPLKGWINDPNGLVFHQGKYHLFAQHYPEDAIWGPMHWAHAVSEDLINWEHLPIALYPDKDGMIFSGSAVSDTRSLSGFGEKDIPPIIAMYTCHGDEETQSIAYSSDGINFTKYSGNPVIPNPGLKDFRDPKMFWNEARGQWGMVLAATDRVHFYATKDFKSWEKTGEFGPEGNHASGIWECPDLIPLDYNGKTMYMLIVSMTTTPEEGKANTQYFLGEFDGSSFRCTVPFGQMEKIDEGWDNYAGVSFNNLNEPILMSWGANWLYADKLPTNEFSGQMTMARRLSLADTKDGIRPASSPIGLEKIFSAAKEIKNGGGIDSEVFYLNIKGSGQGKITLSNKEGQALLIGVDEGNNFYLDRSNAGVNDFDKSFSLKIYSKKTTPRYFDGAYEIKMIFDVSIAEVFIDNGTRCITALAYPDSPYNQIQLDGDLEASISY